MHPITVFLVPLTLTANAQPRSIMSYQFNSATTQSDEATHLESFVESITSSSFPNEIRRVLDHLRYLHSENDAGLEGLRDKQDVCLNEIRNSMVALAASAGLERNNDGESSLSGQSAQVPTNEEIMQHLRTHNPQVFQQHNEITMENARLKQLSAERMQTAHQLRNMVDMLLGRLNRDLHEFERELGIDSTNDSDHDVVTSQTSLAAATSITSSPNMELNKANIQALGLDKSRIHDKKNNIRRTSTTTTSTNPPHPAVVARSNSVALPIPRSAGTLSSKRPQDLAAVQLVPASSEWILAKIIAHDKQKKEYTLSDEDVAENKVYSNIPASQVVPLTKAGTFNRGDKVYAVYPDTTSFYLATVTTCKNNFVMVHFKDDGDEFGVTHEKAVPVWLVMKVPG